jgi:hypothetical protein
MAKIGTKDCALMGFKQKSVYLSSSSDTSGINSHSSVGEISNCDAGTGPENRKLMP